MQLLRSHESSDVLNYAEIATERLLNFWSLWIFILIVHNSLHNRSLDSKSLLLYMLEMETVIYTS